ncbi:MAG: type III pantothenate kinase [Methylococcaceae bacterium]
MNLLIDMGNTRLKWAIQQDSQLLAGRTLINAMFDRQDLTNTWATIATPQHIAISCVSANQLLEQVLSIAANLWPDAKIIHATSQKRGWDVCNAYQQPEKLGVDRWLALVAIRYYYKVPVCIVDCGTAITVDLMDADGNHQGGLISPGLTLMKQALATGTEALLFNDRCYNPGPARFTEAAIYSGTLYAAIGLIESVLSRQTENYRLILTGGDAELIAEQLTVTSSIDADLVLRGLAIILEDKQ